MPKTYRAAVDLAPLLDGISAGELIPELATRGLQPGPPKSLSW
jgi:putative transposase